jgi:dihydrofolate synthase/folylpolyglutamate synthase
LRHAGYRTGLYTSPHLERINERIRVNGEEISDLAFAETFTRIHNLIEELLAGGRLRAHPTYFECVTAMAFEYFAQRRISFGVFEVGLGGRLDATNILTPAVCLITRIDFDHENFLGHSLAEIAAEKAGIFKSGVPVVVAEQQPQAREAILSRAKALSCPVVETNTAYQFEEPQGQGGGRATTRVKEVGGPWSTQLAPQLAGRFQLRNALNAVAAARLLRDRCFNISDQAVQQGISDAVWPGRLEKLQSRPDLYLDGAHNPGAARELAAFWNENFLGRRIFVIYGALRDKAVDEIAGILFPHAAEVIFTEPRAARAISSMQLAEIAAHHAEKSSIISDAEHALDDVLSKASRDDAIFVTGSLYLVGQLRHYWQQRAQVAAR